MYAALEQNEASAVSRESSGGFGAVIERENGRAAARRGCSSQGRLRRSVGIGNDGRFRRRRWLHGNASCVRGTAGLRFLYNADQALIRNFPAEVAMLAALLEILFEEDGTAGIGDENTGSRQKNIPSAILHFHTSPEKG